MAAAVVKKCVRAPWHVVMLGWRFAATTPPRLSSCIHESRGMCNLNPPHCILDLSLAPSNLEKNAFFGILRNRFLIMKKYQQTNTKKYMFISKFLVRLSKISLKMLLIKIQNV